jgi:anti-sigma B factor antagonist
MAMTMEKTPSIDSIGVDADPARDRRGDPPLQVFVSHKTDRTHMILIGELDLAGAPLLVEQLRDISAHHDGDLVIDIGLLTFLDSTGLSVLISQHKKLQDQGHTLTIYSPTPSARRLLEITGLTEVLSIEPLEQPRSLD